MGEIDWRWSGWITFLDGYTDDTPDSHTYRNCDCNCASYCNADVHLNAYPYHNANANANFHTYSNTDSYATPHLYANAQAYTPPTYAYHYAGTTYSNEYA